MSEARRARFRRGDTPFCTVCVYARANLEEAGIVLAPRDGACGLGCRLDDGVCEEMRTSNCSIRTGGIPGE